MTQILLTAALCVGLLGLLYAMVSFFIAVLELQWWDVTVGAGIAVLAGLLAVAAIVVRIVTNGVL